MEKIDISRTLEIAQQFLWDGTRGHIGPGLTRLVTEAIMEARLRRLISYNQWLAARCMINQRLDGYSTVTSWLSSQPGFENVQQRATRVQLQAYRRAWMESMIQEFKNA